jgi:hypothetical protein
MSCTGMGSAVEGTGRFCGYSTFGGKLRPYSELARWVRSSNGFGLGDPSPLTLSILGAVMRLHG